MKKNIIIILLLFVIIALVTYILFRVEPTKRNSQKTDSADKKTTQISAPGKSVSITTQPTIKKPDPEYYVIVNSVPSFNYLGVTLNGTISNRNVAPFITNLAFYNCHFKDENNNDYSGSFHNDVNFDKAVLPNESKDFILKNSLISIKGLSNGLDGLKKCDYDANGQYGCTVINNIKVLDCESYITIDGDQASNGWGKFPKKVEFP